MKHKRSSIESVLEHGYFHKGSLMQNVVVLWASISPSAALLLPSCMKETGIIIGLLIMFFSSLVLFMTQFVLMSSAASLSADNYGNTLLKTILVQDSLDFEGRNSKTLLNESASRYTKVIALLVNLPIFFAMVVTLPCFLMIWCSCVEQLIPPFSNYVTTSGISYNKVILMVICAVSMFPFSLRKELQTTRHISWLSLIAGILFALTVVQYYYYFGASLERGKIIWWNRDINMHSCIKMLTVSCFAFSNHENSPATAHELVNPSITRIFILSGTVSFSSCLLFSIITVFSYLTFGELTLQSVALNYDNESTLLILSKVFLSISNLVACTLSLHAAISSLSNIIIIFKGQVVSPNNFICTDQTTNEKHLSNSQCLSPIDTHSTTNTNDRSFVNALDYIEKHLTSNQLDQDICPTNTLISNIPLNKEIEDKSCHIFDKALNRNVRRISYSCNFQTSKFVDIQTSVNTNVRAIIVFIFLVFSIFSATSLQNLLLFVEVATGFFETLICLIFPLVVYLKLFKRISSWNKYYVRPIFIFLTLICSLGCFTASISAIFNISSSHS